MFTVQTDFRERRIPEDRAGSKHTVGKESPPYPDDNRIPSSGTAPVFFAQFLHDELEVERLSLWTGWNSLMRGGCLEAVFPKAWRQRLLPRKIQHGPEDGRDARSSAPFHL